MAQHFAHNVSEMFIMCTNVVAFVWCIIRVVPFFLHSRFFDHCRLPWKYISVATRFTFRVSAGKHVRRDSFVFWPLILDFLIFRTPCGVWYWWLWFWWSTRPARLQRARTSSSITAACGVRPWPCRSAGNTSPTQARSSTVPAEHDYSTVRACASHHRLVFIRILFNFHSRNFHFLTRNFHSLLSLL